jgi:hypothetical protein
MQRKLAQLSRDHHLALVAAKRLRDAGEATAGDARERFLAYWREHGRVTSGSRRRFCCPPTRDTAIRLTPTSSRCS